MTLSELVDITSNAEQIELFINNSIHPVSVFGGEIPDYFDDFYVTDIYASNNTLVICIEDEDKEFPITDELPFM